jgi:hypothetical protein
LATGDPKFAYKIALDIKQRVIEWSLLLEKP